MTSVSGWYLLIAALSQKLWSAFFTYWKGSIRLISVRRARKEERELYCESEDSRKNVR
ncbi:MAG: BrnT family toxin [Nitrospira sp. CG24A]|nr:MAG: BrnT family toxin [Nitrospira sp. CG24A]